MAKTLTKECIDKLNHSIPLTNYLVKSQKYSGEYNCPFCGSDHHVKYHPDTNIGHCMKSDESFNLIQLIEKIYNLDFLDAAKKIAEDSGTALEYEDAGTGMKKDTGKQASQNSRTGKETEVLDKSIAEDEKPLKTENTASEADMKVYAEMFRCFNDQAASDLFTPEGTATLEYLHKRGLNDNTIKNYKLGYSEKDVYFSKASQTLPAVIFPHMTDNNYYSARSIQGKYFSKPKADYVGKQPLYNPAALYSGANCFICESILDALSIIQSGGNAAALAGTGWKEVLLSQIEKQMPEGVLILSLDNDQNGQKAQMELADALEEKSILFIQAKYSLDQYAGTKKDANDLLRDNPDQLRKDVERINREAITALQPDNTEDYILHTMGKEIEQMKADAGRQTGFENLDYQIGSLYSGLVCIGGTSGLGKTSFALQISDQLAERGNYVLFFSLEQSKLELITKSISRYTAIIDKDNAVTSLQIRTGKKNDLISKATNEYLKKTGGRMNIIEGNFDCNVQAIGEYTADFISRNKVKPVLIIDYLQVLTATPDPKTGRKATDPRIIVNDNMTALKRISRHFEIPVIVLSSLNRNNYLNPIDFESFRESSAIEYSSDLLLGMQLDCMNDELFTKEKSVVEKREKVAEERAKIPREIELLCLKNRFGKSRFSCYFRYDPRYDYFMQPEYSDDKKNDSGWKKLPEQMNIPFDVPSDIPLV